MPINTGKNRLFVDVTSIEVSPKTLTLDETHKSGKITATVKPDNATNKTVTWTSSNPLVEVDANGNVTLVGTPDKDTTVTITAKAGDKEATKEATVTITVKAKQQEQQQPEEKTYTVTYVSEGKTVYTDTVKENTTISVYNGATRKGYYNFKGWKLQGTDKTYTDTITVDKDMVLEAQWEAKYVFRAETVKDVLGKEEVFVKIFVYYGDKDVTSEVVTINSAYSKNGGVGYLGGYNDEYKAITTNKNNVGKIAYVYHNGDCQKVEQIN